MITKEQALTGKVFIQILRPEVRTVVTGYGMPILVANLTNTTPIDKPAKWRANGKCKTWKRDVTRFQLPVKYGLYTYDYITNENAHLFNIGA